MKITTRDVVELALLTALLLVVQVGLAFLPNIELVSLLIMIYTLVLGRKTLYIIYSFAILEGVIYGFGVWWIMYLYVWTILYWIVRLLRFNKSIILWSVISAFFGLAFGALCAVPYAVIGGIMAGFTWWSAGIMFDIIHGVSNFVLVLILFKPVYHILKGLNRHFLYL